MVAYSTATGLQVFDGSAWTDVGAGTIAVESLVIAGGGGGGFDTGGGGGAGGYRTSSLDFPLNFGFLVAVGAGGAGGVGASVSGLQGSSSIFSTTISAGGGGVALLAFLGGLMATLLVYAVARAGGRTEVVTLLLTGIAINAFAQAGLAFVLFLADTASREQIVFWQLGSLAGSVWSEVVIVLPVLVLGTIVAVMMAHRLDLLALGERNARHLGVDVEQLRIIAIVLVALLTGVAVAFAGIIAFVGLVVPHIIRMALGPAHRGLLVASAVGGGALLAIADLLTRTLVAGADLPIGMLTALVGGPFFFALLYQQRRRSGGWA
jgi:iron complex transport system permease protein